MGKISLALGRDAGMRDGHESSSAARRVGATLIETRQLVTQGGLVHVPRLLAAANITLLVGGPVERRDLDE